MNAACPRRQTGVIDDTRPMAAAVAAGLIATAGLHLWRRNAIVSVLGGTAVHVAIASILTAWL
jgi:branched-subunit amino acid transport protein AzlD